MKVQQLTGTGKRESNQDFICINRLESGASFFLIADGMGGYDRGDEAAKIVSENIFTFLNYVDNINEQNIQQAVQKANLAIKQFNVKNNIKSGATIGGIIVEKNISHIFWIGDVMVYQINKDKVLFQTKSHTLINSLLESNSIKEEKSLERYKHIVTRSITGKPSESSIGYQSIEFSEEDSFIICSDGVHNNISIEQILVYTCQENGLQKLERQFLKEAQDNFTIITIQDIDDFSLLKDK
ncbi:PP2C family protein-serine/threonine phosphatase [Flavobacterium lindanitolerans]|uniref:Protein phosphatase n=1 Tax=Flavobacterium lindanitolerans TaxID=428988 RepID=A0A497V9G5_9FLAO|nr:protein phosphatase 2C domain-containing protein [Flavobacterium lindanitolerans]MBC8645353.1 serine/threonine-protein phosphatase [Flavobacterium lindanitolerans]PKW29640.1 protein phosphatase [Flavobacterium lindanitolerans]RLJ34859.1 protein phosphatase [Flavobacterium lindanitolerans]